MSDDNEEDCREFYENLYKSTNKVNIKSYFDQYSKYLKMLTKEKKRNIVDYMTDRGVDEKKLIILSEYCSIDKLTVPGEIEKRTTHRVTWRKDIFENENIPEDINLKTVSEAKLRKQMKKELKHFKYSIETPVHYEKLRDPSDLTATPGQNVLIYVRIYSPYRTTNASKVGVKSGRITLDSVVALHGEQTLAVLKDKISCLSDHSVLHDLSEDPFSANAGPTAKQVYPSCFFYIEGTFYNETRFVNSCDNSQVIRDWAKEKNYGSFKVASMENTEIQSLTPRFGFPWVYQHQGRCEHILVFSDARLFGYDDELSFLAYPRITRSKNHAVRYCMTCGIYSARWITVENDRLPHNPCYFCDNCFKSYNYVDKQKLGNFKAYPYPSDKGMLKVIEAGTALQKNRKKVSKT